MALMDTLYVKGVCPFCGEEFYIGDCAIVSRLSGKTLHPSPQGISRTRSRLSPRRLEGPEYTLEQACRQCPHCGSLLPYNFELVASVTVAIVGDIGSGKSHYIAALIHQLKNGLLQGQSEYLRLTSLTPEIDRTYTNEYLEPLFKNKRSIAPTMTASQQIQKPLIYEITTRSTSSHSTRRFNIILYDGAGEDYVNSSRLIQYSRHVLNASAIIFIADPMTMPEISGRLPAHLQSRTMTTSRSGSEVLNSILASFERYTSVSPGSSLFATPVAIMVSKSDLLKFLTNKSSSYRFLERPQYDGKIDVKDLAVVDQEVRELLAQFGERRLLQVAQSFPKVSFFATSATGYAPDNKGVFPAVEPIRCLDPLLWILWQLRILDEP